MNAAELKRYFSYDGQNLINRCYRHGLFKSKIGEIAGHVDVKGYRIIKFQGKKYKAHRLIWLFIYGKWPDDEIDHINRDRLDNRIENLREADRYINMRNLGNVGVTRFRGQWKARLAQKHLGYFTSYEEAMTARKAAELVHWA